MSVYQIIDEPKPSRASKLAVDPLWPFLATMLGGSWLGWPWFIVNSHAMGSSTKWREVTVVGVGVVGTLALAMGTLMLYHAEHIQKEQLGYAFLAVIVWKLAVSYRLQMWQQSSYELCSYFSPTRGNGMLVLIAGFFASRTVLGWAPNDLYYLLLR